MVRRLFYSGTGEREDEEEEEAGRGRKQGLEAARLRRRAVKPKKALEQGASRGAWGVCGYPVARWVISARPYRVTKDLDNLKLGL